MKFKHIYKDETKELKNSMSSLKIYNRRAYKQLIFKEEFEELDFKLYGDNIYTAELHTDDLFKKVYGTCKVVVIIKNEQAKIIRVEPQDLLLDGYRRLLRTYKGCPYRNEKDLFKIKAIGGLKNGDKSKVKRNIH